MPFGDGTGPLGQGPRTGRGGGRNRNRYGRGGNAGPGGFCVCPSCGKKVSHQAGVPCLEVNCPECGVRMIRE